MSDDRRRRRYRRSKDERQRPVVNVTLAKRVNVDNVGQKLTEMEIQPKILQKNKLEKDARDLKESEPAADTLPLKTIIVTRSEVNQSPTLSVAKDADVATQLLYEPVQQMSRPATVISSTGLINTGVKKLLFKTNTDFLVVGIVGAQGVGKSSIMNLLANEIDDYDYYNKVFEEEDSLFPTKQKQHKCSSRSRTESTHMFITSDRMILLDTPPVLCNSYKKDMITNELDDLHNIITLLSVCHLLIVVQDDYFNMNFIRLLQFAELMKPTHDNKPLISDCFPNVLFVKNRAKRQDFDRGQKESMDKTLKALFRDSQLRVYVGQTAEEKRQKKGRSIDAVINSFLLPDVKGASATSYHNSLKNIVEDLRTLVFTTPRNEMHTEASWFELLTKTQQDTQHFFFDTYEEIHRKHLDLAAGSNNKETQEIWRESV